MISINGYVRSLHNATVDVKVSMCIISSNPWPPTDTVSAKMKTKYPVHL